MKKIIIATLLITCFFSCKEKNENTDSSETITEHVETEKEENKSPKFEDINGCSQYSNLFEALPHLDSYKNLEFDALECMSLNEKSAFTTNLNVTYFDNKSKTNIKVNLFEVSGESAKEEVNNISMAKASFNTLAKIPSSNTFKSSLTIFENATVNIAQSADEKELSKATYLGTYKDKYSIWIDVEMPGKIDVLKIDLLLKEYLDAFKKESLN